MMQSPELLQIHLPKQIGWEFININIKTVGKRKWVNLRSDATTKQKVHKKNGHVNVLSKNAY